MTGLVAEAAGTGELTLNPRVLAGGFVVAHLAAVVALAIRVLRDIVLGGKATVSTGCSITLPAVICGRCP